MTVSLHERRRRETSAEVSRVAMRLFAERGFDAVQLAGGMMAWRAQKLPEARG